MKRIARCAAAAPVSVLTSSVAIRCQYRTRGDFGFNVFHNSNPQHGAAYTRFERKMNDDEFEDFLRSVKGWEANAETHAINKKFTFDCFGDAYLFVGKLQAFCYGLDKFPPFKWGDNGLSVHVQLYSPSFKGISKREAKVAAFMNDQFNMIKKTKVQRDRLALLGENSSVSELVGESAREEIERRQMERPVLPEVVDVDKVAKWSQLISDASSVRNT